MVIVKLYPTADPPLVTIRTVPNPPNGKELRWSNQRHNPYSYTESRRAAG